MKTRATALVSLFAAVAAVAACQSSSDDSASGGAGSGATSPAGSSNVAGSGGHGGGGSPNANGGAGTSGATAGAANGHAGAGGLAGGGGSGGHEAGAGGELSSAGNDDGNANGGEAGNPGDGKPEFAYVSTVLGGVFALSLELSSGKPLAVPGTHLDLHTSIYAVSVDPAQRFVYLLDQGGKLDSYRIKADGTLPATPDLSTAIVGNPVTLALDPKGRFAYVGTHHDADSLIEAFKVDATSGALTSAGDALSLSGAPAYVAVDPTGTFVYVTQSAATGIWGYKVDQTTGLLTKIEGSPFGGNAVFSGAIAIQPGGAFLYTSGSGLNAFAIAPDSGKLDRVEGSPFAPDVGSDPSATNIAIEPRGKFLYASQSNGGNLFGFAILAGGKLQAVPGPVITVSVPYSVAVEPSGRFVYVGQDDGKLAVLALNRGNGSLEALLESPFSFGGLQPETAFAVP